MKARRHVGFFGAGSAWLGIFLLGCQVSSAQDYRAKVQGVVTDTSQAVVIGARVTLHNDNTGVDAAKTTNEGGHYGFDFVDPGTYTVTVEQPGFTKFVQRSVLVQVRGDVTVNAALTVGEIGRASCRERVCQYV